jgi:hypothetical protein
MTFDPKISYIKRPKYIPKKDITPRKELLTNVLVSKIDMKKLRLFNDIRQ